MSQQEKDGEENQQINKAGFCHQRTSLEMSSAEEQQIPQLVGQRLWGCYEYFL